jgi:delta1-piperideine-2-carboxylate reductase
MSDQVQLTLEQVHELSLNALVAQGISQAQANAISDTITAAERDECKSHGLFRVPFYIKALGNPNVNPQAIPQITTLAPSVLHVEAGFGFAPLALELSREPLIEMAREQGIAALCINNAYHIAALWPETEALAEQGLVAFAFTASMSSVAPAGGTKPLFGTNPMAFAWPRPGRPPLVFDQASSVTARGEIQLHMRDGKPIPEGWAIDPDGNPTTDPEQGLAGAQLTFGGHKGSSISLMVELLAGALIGDVFSYEAKARDTGTGAPCGGEFIMAINPARCVPGGDTQAQGEHAEDLFAKILEQEGTRLPSDRRFAARKRTPDQGVSIPQSLYDTLQGFLAT